MCSLFLETYVFHLYEGQDHTIGLLLIYIFSILASSK